MKIEELAEWFRCDTCESQFLVYLPLLCGPVVARLRILESHAMNRFNKPCTGNLAYIHTERGGVTAAQIVGETA